MNNPFGEINRWTVFFKGEKIGEKKNFLPNVNTPFTLNGEHYLVYIANYAKHTIVAVKNPNAKKGK